MRILLLFLSFITLLLCSCPEEEEKRERERRADEENHACRSCLMISKLADENCPVGFECNPDWELTSNVLSPNDCGCSELRCAVRNATLAVDGRKEGKIRCKAHEWTLLSDSSITTTSAVCAKSCGKRVCAWSHPKPSRDLYSPIDAKDPSQDEPCASAECPKGIAVFTDEGDFKETLSPTPLVCSSNGKWKIGDAEERNVMCQEKCMCRTDAMTDGSHGSCLPNMLCVPPTDGDECAFKCPEKSWPRYLDAAGISQQAFELKCIGKDWIAAGATEVTCEYSEGAAEHPTPSGTCAALVSSPCAIGGQCDDNPVAYTPYKTGWRATCTNGVLFSQLATFPGYIYVADCLTDTWKDPAGIQITTATCVTNDAPVKACLTAVLGGSASVEYSCRVGACWFNCLDSTQQIEFNFAGETEKQKARHVKCIADKLLTLTLVEIENAKCV